MTTILERFLATKQSVNTKAAYRSDLDSFFDRLNGQGEGWAYPEFCQVSPAVLSEKVRAYLDGAQRVDEHRGYVLNPRTVNRKLSALSSFFAYLVTWYHYPRNPMSCFSSLPVLQKSTTETLDVSEVMQVLEFLKKERDQKQTETAYRNYLTVLFLFRYALRRSELVSLKWEDFKPEEGTFKVIQKGNDPMVKPLVPEHWKLLCEFREFQRKSREDRLDQREQSPDLHGDDHQEACQYVFHAIRPHFRTGRYEPLSTIYVFKMVCSVTKKLFPTKNITPHSFRGTFVGVALNQNIEPGEIANGTGHKSVRMVYYYDRRDPIEHNAIAKLKFP